MNEHELLKDIKLGVATASLQIEGGDRNNSWYDWCEAGKIPNGDHCIIANDHWNRAAQDIELMKDLHLDTYRMSLEWSRIEPREGQFDQSAIQHYRTELLALKAAGIEPLVTLHHFSNPTWFESDGAWMDAKCIDRFLKFVEIAVLNFGDIVTEWTTINEPNVYLFMGYVDGDFPPGVKGDIRAFLKGAKHMSIAHCKAYELIHSRVKEKFNLTPRVGAAVHVRVFDAFRNTLLERLACHLYYRLFQEIFLDAMIAGKSSRFLGLGSSIRPGRYSDFIGINYYSRDILKGKWDPANLFAERLLQDNAKTNDLKWEIYPEGLGRLIRKYYEQFGLPIYITENGTADASDAFRQEYIKSHLEQILSCKAQQIPVERYYYWTLMDNFEWMEGYDARFGLIAHQVESQSRKIRESGKYYATVCRDRRL